MHRALPRPSSTVRVPFVRSFAHCALVVLAAACDKASDPAPAPAATSSTGPASPVAPAVPTAAAKTYLCPMDCEHGKTYAAKGKCPVCEMDLEEAVEGKFAHSDHHPKHGGQFIMASDNWHHIEGTLPEPRKFVAWFYNNFSKPLAVGKTTAKVSVMTKARSKGQKAEYADLEMTPGTEPTTLVAPLPENVPWPVQMRVVVTFEGLEPMTFNYYFEKVTTEPVPGAADAAGSEAAPHTHAAMDMKPLPTERTAILAEIRKVIGDARALLEKKDLKAIHTKADRIGRLATALAMSGGGEGRMNKLAKDLDAQGDGGNAAGVTEVLGELEKDLATADR